MTRFIRRWGFTGLAVAVGGLLFVSGIAFAAVDAQARSDAATAAMTLTADDREKLDEGGMYESVLSDVPFVRRSLILQNLQSGGPVPERYFEVTEMEGGGVSMSWGAQEGGFHSWGGWQLKPVGILTFVGLGLILATGFVAAARREKRHPLV